MAGKPSVNFSLLICTESIPSTSDGLDKSFSHKDKETICNVIQNPLDLFQLFPKFFLVYSPIPWRFTNLIYSQLSQLQEFILVSEHRWLSWGNWTNKAFTHFQFFKIRFDAFSGSLFPFPLKSLLRFLYPWVYPMDWLLNTNKIKTLYYNNSISSLKKSKKKFL